jgi:hypothetical protein
MVLEGLHTIIDHTEIRMILEIVPYPWQIYFYWNVELIENVWITNTREL